MLNLFRRFRREPAPATALICTFGDEPLLREDESIYRAAGFEVETAEFVGIEDFSSFMEGKQFTVVHAFLRPDAEGKVEGLPDDDFFECLADAGTKILLFASDGTAEALLKYAPGDPASYYRMAIIYTLDRKGESFRTFFTELFTMMMEKRMRLTSAWVRLAPQNPNDLREGNPEVLLMV